MRKIFLLLALSVSADIVLCANILCVFPTPSVSHQVVFQPIWKELSLRGHRVTVITPDPLRDPTLVNLTEIDVSYAYHYFDLSPVFGKHLTPDQVLEAFYLDLWPPSFEEEMQHPEVQALLHTNDSKFDIVLAEMLYAPGYAFAWKFNCPWIGVLSLPSLLPSERAIGNLLHPIINPDYLLGYVGKLSFWKRLFSAYSYIKSIYKYEFQIMPEMDKMARKYFGDNIPYLGDIEKNVSMLFSNVNLMATTPRPQVPSVIEMGMMHINKEAKLPKELQREMNEASQGIVYVSLGSNVRSANLSIHIRETLLSTFAELPYKVLWKWESDYLPGQPDNVVISKWLPQQAVLAHPNVKVFITQGGFQSTEESIYYRKPLIGMPFFFDQEMNVQKIVHYGIGLKADVHTLTKKELKDKIFEIVRNKRFYRRISEVADLILDQPMSGLEKAVWWTEYVIRHKGAKHLRSPLLEIPFYQYLLLDLIIFAILAAFFLVGIIFMTLKFLKPLIIEVAGFLIIGNEKKTKTL